MQRKQIWGQWRTAFLILLASLIIAAWPTARAFAASQIDFSQCINDNGAGSKHDGDIDLCDWSHGAINAVNSDYAESDGVPQRVILLHTATSANEHHSLTFQYDFSKNNIYAYDFLANVDHTMPMSLINPCGNLPAFTNSADCQAALDPAVVQSVPIASDSFDSVSSAEHPPYPERAMLVTCKSLSGGTDKCTNFTYTITHNTSTCYQNCGTSTAEVTLGFNTQSTGQYLIMVYFSGELSASSIWGTGYGASSAPGASFHMRLINVDGSSVGNQDNQIQVPKAAHNADLAITKTAPSTIGAGNDLTYVINVTNGGPDAATAVVVNDTLPLSSDITYVSSTPSQGPQCTLSGNNLTCDIGLLEYGDTATVTVILHVDPATPNGTVLINTATVTGNIIDSTPGDNTAQTTTTVSNPPSNPSVDMQVTKTDNPDPVTAGDSSPLTYTVNVTNNDSTTGATGVIMTDSLPPQTTFVSANSTQGTCSETGGIVTCDIGNVGAGGTVTITIEVDVKASTPAGKIYNTATVTENETDPTPSNNSTTIDTTVQSSPDLSITKTDSPDPIASGDQLTYSLSVTNHGPSDAFDVTVADTLPAEATFVSASTGCSFSNGVVTCTISHLPVGESQNFDILVLVASPSPTTITNTAVVTPNDDTPGDNTATATTTVNVPETTADVSIVKSAPGTVQMGSTFDYSLTVTNNGPATATHVTITDVIPDQVTYLSYSAPAGTTCSVTNGILDCELGDMSYPSSKNISVRVQVDSSFFGTITNTAVVAAGGDNDPDNDQSTVSTRVPAPPPPPPHPSTPVTVPAINEWGLILFMVMAGLGGVFMLVKKRKA